MGFLSSAPGTPRCLLGAPLPLAEERDRRAAGASPLQETALTLVLPSPTAAYQGTCACEEVGTKAVPVRHLPRRRSGRGASRQEHAAALYRSGGDRARPRPRCTPLAARRGSGVLQAPLPFSSPLPATTTKESAVLDTRTWWRRHRGVLLAPRDLARAAGGDGRQRHTDLRENASKQNQECTHVGSFTYNMNVRCKDVQLLENSRMTSLGEKSL